MASEDTGFKIEKLIEESYSSGMFQIKIYLTANDLWEQAAKTAKEACNTFCLDQP